MNNSSRFFFRPLTAALLLCATFPVFAQEPPKANKSAPAEPNAAAAEPNAAPAAPNAPAPVDAAPAVTPDAAAAAPRDNDRTGLREVGASDANAAATESAPRRRRNRGGGGEFPFGDHTVAPGNQRQDVVSVFGSSTVAGEVTGDAVSVGGNTTVARGAKVGGSAVAVLGRLKSEGDIGGEAVSVFGGVEINGHVHDEAVAVFGNMTLGPNAVVDGDVVVVGGQLTKHPDAVVQGNEVRVPFLGGAANVDWFVTWVKRCVFYGRLLAFDSHLRWAWAVAFSFLAFYLLLALLFPRGMVKCAQTFETRPGYSILASVLTVLLTPVAIVLLAITIVGALLVPFLGAGLMFASLFGKAVMLAWIGRRFTKFFGEGPLSHPALAVLIGGLIVILVYTVPIAGFLTYKLLSWLGLGVVVYTVALGMRRDKASATRPMTPRPVTPASGGSTVTPPAAVPTPPVARAATEPMPVVPPVPPVPPAYTPAAAMGITTSPSVSAGFSGASSAVVEPPSPPPNIDPVSPPATATIPETPPLPPAMETPPVTPPPPPVTPPPPRVTVPPGDPTVWPRASFFLRLGALALDGVLVGLVLAFISGMLPRFLHFNHAPGGWLIVLAIYGAIMWKHKGTTIGGIVCGLKVVRLDHRELDWATAIVRALACFLSLAVAGLGFIWVAIDDERQSWHDKIAGTAVVVVPKGVSLL